MKSILLIRHAKSSWNFDLKDKERPLNNRGRTDAPAMAERLIKKEVAIDAFVSSPAVRAFDTATFFAKAYQKKSKEIIVIPSLYEPAVAAFFNVIIGLNDEFNTVAIFSHNSGITDFVNKTTATKIDNMPTCAVYAVKAHIDSWASFKEKDNEFWFFEYPKSP